MSPDDAPWEREWLQEQIRQAVQAAYEDAARIAESQRDSLEEEDYNIACQDVAQAIRERAKSLTPVGGS